MALRHRLGKNIKKMEAKAHELQPMEMKAHVWVQNQTGHSPRRWDRTGVVVGHNRPLGKYWVKMDGCRRVRERNRKFLRLFKPAKPLQLGSDVGGPGEDQAPASLPEPVSAVDRREPHLNLGFSLCYKSSSLSLKNKTGFQTNSCL